MVRGKAKNDDDKYVAYSKEEWDNMMPVIEELLRRNSPKMTHQNILDWLGVEKDFHPSLSAFKRKVPVQRYRTESRMLEILQSQQQPLPSRARQIGDRNLTANDAYEYFNQRGRDKASVDAMIPNDSSDSGDMVYTPTSQAGSSSGPGYGAQTATSSAAESDGYVYVSAPASRVVDQLWETVHRSSNSIPQTPSPVYVDKATENLLRSVTQYYGSNIGKKWIVETKENNIDGLCPSMSFGSLFLKFDNEQKMHLYSKSYSTRATIFDQTRSLLQIEDPRLLLYFLEALAFSRAYGHEQLALEVNWTFMKQAEDLWNQDHPITVFCGSLLHKPRDIQDAMVEKALECMLAQYIANLNYPFELETTRVLLTGAMVLKHLGLYTTAMKFLKLLFPLYQTYYGEHCSQAVQCLIDESHIHIALGNHVEAGDLISRASTLEEGIPDGVESAESKMRILVAHAVLLGLEGEMQEKRKALQNVQHLGWKYRLGDDHWAVRDARAREVQDFGSLGLVA